MISSNLFEGISIVTFRAMEMEPKSSASYHDMRMISCRSFYPLSLYTFVAIQCFILQQDDMPHIQIHIFLSAPLFCILLNSSRLSVSTSPIPLSLSISIVIYPFSGSLLTDCFTSLSAREHYFGIHCHLRGCLMLSELLRWS